MNKYDYFCNCVNWKADDVHCPGGLCDMTDGMEEIKREEFLARANLRDLVTLEEELGYAARDSDGLCMADDWHVTYFCSKHHGDTVYGFVHSGIEFVFKEAPSGE